MHGALATPPVSFPVFHAISHALRAPPPLFPFQSRAMGLDLGVDVITQLPLSDKVDRAWFKKQVRMGHYDTHVGQ